MSRSCSSRVSVVKSFWSKVARLLGRIGSSRVMGFIIGTVAQAVCPLIYAALMPLAGHRCNLFPPFFRVCNLLPLHGVRFRFGRKLSAARRLPSTVFGPVL